MLLLQFVLGTVFGCILMSFLEHQIHMRLMHRKNYLSERYPSYRRTFEAHAIQHHGHYSKIFADEPVPLGEDKEIRLTTKKAPFKALPFALVISLVSWPAGLCFIGVVTFHHWCWNKIHLEMHKPEQRGFSKWPAYKFLARHHYLHHVYPNKNFNVVFPFADYVLGTNAKAKPADVKAMQDLGFLDGPAIVAAAPVAVERERELVKR